MSSSCEELTFRECQSMFAVLALSGTLRLHCWWAKLSISWLTIVRSCDSEPSLHEYVPLYQGTVDFPRCCI